MFFEKKLMRRRNGALARVTSVAVAPKENQWQLYCGSCGIARDGPSAVNLAEMSLRRENSLLRRTAGTPSGIAARFFTRKLGTTYST
jgi:hypothetical protein